MKNLLTAAVVAFFLCSCLPMGDRIAGTSTEAGNAGGKLSLADGRPAAGVSVALVARSYLPDTLMHGNADVPGAYYRTRTGPDGRFLIDSVLPGSYRMVAVGAAGGVMADSLQVNAGEDTALVEGTLKPLGAIRGVAKLVGSDAKVNLWIRPKATVQYPPRADTMGAFRLDSLPEGDYELIPQCFSCQPSPRIYKVRVRAGMDTLMSDTLKLWPEYFQGFPAGGDLTIRSALLPFSMGGKINRGAEDDVRPSAVTWTWNGLPLASHDVATPEGIAETSVILDSSLFTGADSGGLRLSLTFPDTVISRDWHVTLDIGRDIWPLSAVEADQAVEVPGPVGNPTWRFHLVHRIPLDSADVAFWGLQPGEPNPNTTPLHDWVELSVDDADLSLLQGPPGTGNLTFILVPDARFGGRVLRPRRDEHLDDFREILFLARAHLGFTDSVVPSMLPGGLILDRTRVPAVQQRYCVDSSGNVEELLGPVPISVGGPQEDPLLFYRSGPAAAGFAWNQPFRDAAKILAVTREGSARRLDGSGPAVQLSATEVASLESLLEPLARQPYPLPDTASLSGVGTLQYLRFGGRGTLRSADAGGPPDSLFTAFRAWMVRNGLDEGASFPLSGGAAWRYLGFQIDSGALRYTGDTLILERTGDDSGLQVRESLSPNSPFRVSGDTAAFVYRLGLAGDSLVALSGPAPVTSRLFGNIDGRLAAFPLAGLPAITPAFQDGLPILTGNDNVEAGRPQGALDVLGRTLASPGLFLDARGSDQGMGFLFTADGGVERAWRFGGRSGIVRGWDRE